ncbi:hypothetical protein Mal4_53110 [Maioricimonas rarisocia]|uniref:DUF5658 domain-containing protein n=1 Tax=Maioricimonas rarisocia TaxID=2528026 RepID=A0A517ZEQ7_9PLAN|nr:DUF5658 family protein [Maioricimonas rarisocia]QDU40948.1 hypothetical protein Mal4_53110 [Maioricimonas rarisocia]
MAKSGKRRTGPIGKLLHTLFRRQLPLEHETAMFVLVNVLDFLATWWMLTHGRSGNRVFVESNPIASYFLYGWGPFKGMLMFKLALVLFVCGIAQVIAVWKPQTASRLLNFGTLAVGAVVIYSATLYVRNI